MGGRLPDFKDFNSRAVRRAGGDLLLAAPCGQVRRILTLTGMIGVFPVSASVAEAVRIAGCSRPLAPARRHPSPPPGDPAIPGARIAALSGPGDFTQDAALATEQPVTLNGRASGCGWCG